MRIGLDYYRILGVPIETTAEQILQAYTDRTVQMIRQEYSDVAITARKQLLERAFSVLSDSKKRAEYNTQFLEKTSLLESEIREDDSEPVLDELSSGDHIPSIEIDSEELIGALVILQELGEYEIVLRLAKPWLLNTPENPEKSQNREDVILTSSLAGLELAREQWQQGEYENAALSLNQAYHLLLEENLFLDVQQEIKTDIHKLRPYRILELLALSEEKLKQRVIGFQLLKQMLQERNGIDGKGDDQSGLSTDDFLRFIEQLQKYLTVTEQQELFESESLRPSAVATYLAFYAFLAKGFAQKKPALIVRAQEMLQSLSKRQDIYLEQSVCALLLGKTNEAIAALEKTEESDTVNFIKQNSQGSQDLLPGLCLYAERWLQTEVFSRFRDLAKKHISLQEYFDDRLVQIYLEKLQTDNFSPSESHIQFEKKEDFFTSSFDNSSTNNLLQETEKSDDENYLDVNLTHAQRESNNYRTQKNAVSTKKNPVKSNKNSRRVQKEISNRKKLLPWALLAVLGFGIVSIIYNIFKAPTKPEITNNTPIEINLNKPPLEIPKPPTQTEKLLDQEIAKEIIQNWLSAKAKAFGSNHQMNELNKILTKGILSQWVEQSQQLKNTNSYRNYQHSYQVRSLRTNPQKPEEAIVQAEVKEASQFYQNGQKNVTESYSSKLLVDYELVWVNNQWFIKKIKVISNLP